MSVISDGGTNAAIAAMAEMFKGIDASQGPAQYRDAKLAATCCQKVRKRLDEAHKEKKADALAFGRRLDTEKNRILAMIEAIEFPIRTSIKEVDQAEERLEQARVAAIMLRIDAIVQLGMNAMAVSTLEQLNGWMKELISTKLDDSFREFLDDAEGQAQIARARINNAIRDLEARQAEEQRLEAKRKEQAAEDARLADERRRNEARDRELRDRQERMDREESARQALVKAENDERQRKLDDEQARLRAEAEKQQRRLDKQAAENKAEAKRLAEEARERELEAEAARKAEEDRQRAEAMKPDVDRMMDYAARIEALVPPIVVNNELAEIGRLAYENVRDAANDLRRQIGELT
jgi:hypothetical protein